MRSRTPFTFEKISPRAGLELRTARAGLELGAARSVGRRLTQFTIGAPMLKEWTDTRSLIYMYKPHRLRLHVRAPSLNPG